MGIIGKDQVGLRPDRKMEWPVRVPAVTKIVRESNEQSGRHGWPVGRIDGQ